MGPVAQLVFKTSAVVQPTARSVRLRRRSVAVPPDGPPTVGEVQPGLSAVLKIAIALGLAMLVAYLVPRLNEGGGDTPPVGTLLLTASLIGLVTTVLLYFVLTRDIGLPATVAIFAVCWNLLVIAVKFVLGPLGYYEVNQEVVLEDFLSLADQQGAFLAAAFVLPLYAAGYWILFRIIGRSDLGVRLRVPRPGAGAAVSAVAVVIAAAAGGVVLLIPLVLFASSGLEYLSFVFTSGVALLVGLLLALAAVFAGLSFRTAAQRATLVGNVALLSGLLWVGLAFLALYHAVWVVYVLVLTSIWPLKTVSSK
jgi:hypothetical protein